MRDEDIVPYEIGTLVMITDVGETFGSSPVSEYPFPCRIISIVEKTEQIKRYKEPIYEIELLYNDEGTCRIGHHGIRPTNINDDVAYEWFKMHKEIGLLKEPSSE